MALTITESVPVGLDMQPCASGRAYSILLPPLPATQTPRIISPELAASLALKPGPASRKPTFQVRKPRLCTWFSHGMRIGQIMPL